MLETIKRWNYWPWIITAMFLTTFLLLVLMIRISVVNVPVVLDERYRQNYQFVDEHINEYLRMSKQFDEQGYAVAASEAIQLGTNRFDFALTDARGEPVADAKVDLIVTREATNKQDIVVGTLAFENGRYHTQEVRIDQPGVWVLDLHIQLGELEVQRQFFRTIVHEGMSEDQINARSRMTSMSQKP